MLSNRMQSHNIKIAERCPSRDNLKEPPTMHAVKCSKIKDDLSNPPLGQIPGSHYQRDMTLAFQTSTPYSSASAYQNPTSATNTTDATSTTSPDSSISQRLREKIEDATPTSPVSSGAYASLQGRQEAASKIASGNTPSSHGLAATLNAADLALANTNEAQAARAKLHQHDPGLGQAVDSYVQEHAKQATASVATGAAVGGALRAAGAAARAIPHPAAQIAATALQGAGYASTALGAASAAYKASEAGDKLNEAAGGSFNINSNTNTKETPDPGLGHWS